MFGPLDQIARSCELLIVCLHFEVKRSAQVVDPYAGPLSRPESLWVAQGPEGNEIPAAQCR